MQLPSEGYFGAIFSQPSNQISRSFSAVCKTHVLHSSWVLTVVPLFIN